MVDPVHATGHWRANVQNGLILKCHYVLAVCELTPESVSKLCVCWQSEAAETISRIIRTCERKKALANWGAIVGLDLAASG